MELKAIDEVMEALLAPGQKLDKTGEKNVMLNGVAAYYYADDVWIVDTPDCSAEARYILTMHMAYRKHGEPCFRCGKLAIGKLCAACSCDDAAHRVMTR